MVEMLREHPTWLALLLRALGHDEHAPPAVVTDPTLRLTDPAEVTLDLMFGEAEGGAWTLVEVQLKVDADKESVWPLAVAWQRHRRGVAGDLLVITASESVARWADAACAARGALGTSFTLRPVVVHLGLEEAHALLATGRAELAFFAAWALHDRHGDEAVEVVTEAVRRLDAEPDERLRRSVLRAILNTVHDRLVEHFRSYFMSASNYPESPAFRALRVELEDRARDAGLREGRVMALLAVLAAKNIAVDVASRERITRCDDADRLDAWIRRAAVASALADVFDDAH